MIDVRVKGIGWLGIVRLGTVQAAIGAMVMLATSLLNRVMVVEYGLAAAIPAALVGWHYAVQLSRPLWGHKSDRAPMRTAGIIAGLSILAVGILVAVDATVMMAGSRALAVGLAVAGFTMIGVGVGAAGTGLLALLASRVAPARKPAAAAISWTMMVMGIVVAAGTSGSFLDPFSDARLALVATSVVAVAYAAALLALRGLEAGSAPVAAPRDMAHALNFAATLREIWRDDQARRFTWFVFISMLAYSMQDLILEPFAGLRFAMTPGETTKLTGVQHSGVLMGMILAGAGGSLLARRYGPNAKIWIMTGCFASALMLAGLSLAATVGPAWPLKANVFALGVANGTFAVAAVGAMLGMASDGAQSGEGARMGVWGAAQAVAFGAGGLLGAVIVDLLRRGTGDDGGAFQAAFGLEAAMFILAAIVATGTTMTRRGALGQAAQA